MEKLIFREEQSFRQSVIPWFMLAAMLFMIVGFGVGFYQKLYLGKPLGDDPASDSGLIWSSIISFVLMTAAFILILSGILETEIWTDGIRYKFAPFIRKTRLISLKDMTSGQVEKYNPIIEFGGWGLRKRFLKQKRAYSISGSYGVRVTLKNGTQIMFGTQKQEEMKRAVTKLWHTDTNN